MGLGTGYEDDETRDLVREFGLTAQVRARGEGPEELKREAGQKARGGVVERTPELDGSVSSGPDPRGEPKVEDNFGMLHFVCAWITCRAAGRLG